MAGNIVELDRVVVAYRESVALREISLSVPAGEFVGIVGPNGAGKTTLLTLVNGLTVPTRGAVRVLGQEVTPGTRHYLRKRVGYVAQAESVDARMPVSVRDVAAMGRYGVLGLLHRPGQRDRALVDEALEMVGVRDLASRPIGHLSGGEQQRVAIARCLAQEPAVFLLDEPTASLDWKTRAEILQLVRNIHQTRRLTTLFVTHDLDALPHACDRVILMKGGLIVGDGRPDRVVTAQALSNLYDLPASVVEERRPHVHPEEH
jgi:ABC-type cobalamin/Fe3+-siderophores transport system ATPase subunit